MEGITIDYSNHVIKDISFEEILGGENSSALAVT